MINPPKNTVLISEDEDIWGVYRWYYYNKKTPWEFIEKMEADGWELDRGPQDRNWDTGYKSEFRLVKHHIRVLMVKEWFNY